MKLSIFIKIINNIKHKLKKTFKKFIILYRGKFIDRVLRCNKDTNPECKCGKVIKVYKTKSQNLSRTIDKSMLLALHTQSIFNDSLNLFKKIDCTNWPLNLINDKSNDFYILQITNNNNNPITIYNNLHEEQARELFLKYLHTQNNLLYLEVKHKDTVLQSVLNKTPTFKC